MEAPMESSRGRWRWGGRSSRCALMVVLALFFVVAVSLCCVRLWACGGSSGCRGSTVAVLRSEIWRRTPASWANPVSLKVSRQWRRLLSEGPGSYPPRCSSKCGGCNPCYPVHVAVPPGVPVTTEYYPEAWRCRCGNRLYMP